MTQKLSDMIQRFSWIQFPRVKTKVEVRREALKKAWRSRKRMAAIRAAAAEKAKEQDVGREAA